jgi:hypothetical protein
MDPRSSFFRARVLAIVLAASIGCASKSCPPCDASASSAQEANSSGNESVSGEYYALPGLDHGLLQSPVNILSRETEAGRHTIKFGGDDKAKEVALFSTAERVGSARIHL